MAVGVEEEDEVEGVENGRFEDGIGEEVAEGCVGVESGDCEGIFRVEDKGKVEVGLELGRWCMDGGTGDEILVDEED